jgi:hypothetical protein
MIYFSFALAVSLPASAMKKAPVELIIVEFNAAVRPPREESTDDADATTLKKMIDDERKQDEADRNFVVNKVAAWQKRFAIPSSNVAQLHTENTAPHLIEASSSTIAAIINESTVDDRINVMRVRDLLDFDNTNLSRVFSVTNPELIGEFVEAQFKNELMFAVWHSTQIRPTFSEEADIFNAIIKRVSYVSLEKLDRIEGFMRTRGVGYFPSILKIHRLARQIIRGTIEREGLPPSLYFPLKPAFFEGLKLFNNLGIRMLLADQVAAEQIFERWLGFQRKAMFEPHLEDASPKTYRQILSLLGHQAPAVRNEFALDLATMILEFENVERVVVTGVPDSRMVQLALSIARAREDAVIKHNKSLGIQPPGIEDLRRVRFSMAQELLQAVFPLAQIAVDQNGKTPPSNVTDIVDQLFRLDYSTAEFGRDFSPTNYRASVLQVVELIVKNAKNPEFKRFISDRTTDWLIGLSHTNDLRDHRQAIANVERLILKPRRCEDLFQAL